MNLNSNSHMYLLPITLAVFLDLPFKVTPSSLIFFLKTLPLPHSSRKKTTCLSIYSLRCRQGEGYSVPMYQTERNTFSQVWKLMGEDWLFAPREHSRRKSATKQMIWFCLGATDSTGDVPRATIVGIIKMWTSSRHQKFIQLVILTNYRFCDVHLQQTL